MLVLHFQHDSASRDNFAKKNFLSFANKHEMLDVFHTTVCIMFI